MNRLNLLHCTIHIVGGVTSRVKAFLLHRNTKGLELVLAFCKERGQGKVLEVFRFVTAIERSFVLSDTSRPVAMLLEIYATARGPLVQAQSRMPR